jgi:hypothetical protein
MSSMHVTSRRRVAATVVAVGASLTLVAGAVTAVSAATKPKTYHACASSSGALSLLAHGHCAHGTHRVAIAARGPAGARGPKGNAGPPATSLWARVAVSAQGSSLLAGSRHVVSVTNENTATTSVTFDQDVSGCAWVATSVNPSDVAGIFDSVGDSVDVETVSISTHIDDPASFSLAVFC